MRLLSAAFAIAAFGLSGCGHAATEEVDTETVVPVTTVPAQSGNIRAVIHATGDASGFYRFAAPLMNRMVRRNIRKDLETLKARIERFDVS